MANKRRKTQSRTTNRGQKAKDQQSQATPVKERWIIAPNDNTFNSGMNTKSSAFLTQLSGKSATPEHPAQARIPEMEGNGVIRVLDQIELNESTLVEMSETEAVAMKRQFPGLRIEPERWLRMLRTPVLHPLVSPPLTRLANASSLQITVEDSDTKQPIEGADVTVIFNQKTRVGVGGLRTNPNGLVTIPVPTRVKKIDLIYVSLHKEHWPAAAEKMTITPNQSVRVTIPVVSIDKTFKCSLLKACAPAITTDGEGVKIAVIDGGVTKTPVMKNLEKGLNTTNVEPMTLTEDNGSGHGTHVAGIIARIAPAATIYAYRVFAEGAEGASDFAIAKAIRDAVDKGCDLINLSLGVDVEPLPIIREIRRARALGTVCVAAAGNESGPISYPARSPNVVAVTAFGYDQAYPLGAAIALDIAKKPRPISPYFFASFSNYGPEADLIGPGVGVISDVSGTAIGIMSGTSMASPAVVGLIARLLARHKAIYDMNGDQERSDEIISLALRSAQPIGWGLKYEGQGFIR